MGTVKKAQVMTKKVGYKGWKADSKDGKFLEKLIASNKISAGTTPAALKDMHPQFNAYKPEALASAFRRLKQKYGTNVRGDTSGEIVVSCWLCFLLLFFESSLIICCLFSFEQAATKKAMTTMMSFHPSWMTRRTGWMPPVLLAVVHAGLPCPVVANSLLHRLLGQCGSPLGSSRSTRTCP
jgi:hypothetical protein